ncbi:MAG: 2-hydroxycarboxylate transporter family protein [Lachnospiraceae bacterium]|nr:2-hydroxycarboxylate transporter family protein [Lachnospiraceae bacterium]
MKKFKLFDLPIGLFAIYFVIVYAALYAGVLPGGMVGGIAWMIVTGTVLKWAGDHLPIVKDYLGGGSIFIMIMTAVMAWLKLVPESLAENIGNYFGVSGGFLDVFIASLICGSVLGMNKKLLVASSKRYFPSIIGGLVLSFACLALLGSVMGYGWANAILYIAMPIMGGGFGSGTALAKVYEANGFISAAEGIGIMTPTITIGNAVSIIMAGLLCKLIKSPKLNGNGMLLQKTGGMDPKDLQISPEMKAKREELKLEYLAAGCLTMGAFFAWGFILAKLWSLLVPSISIHAYAWMIISVAVCKITGILPEAVEIGAHQWYTLIVRLFSPAILAATGLIYLDIAAIIESMTWSYLVLCLVCCATAFIGAAFVGKWCGLFFLEGGITGGLCMSNMGGNGDIATLSAANRMELMPFAQISSRLGGALVLVIGGIITPLIMGFVI